jgi:hypothetical protein
MRCLRPHINIDSNIAYLVTSRDQLNDVHNPTEKMNQ